MKQMNGFFFLFEDGVKVKNEVKVKSWDFFLVLVCKFFRILNMSKNNVVQ